MIKSISAWAFDPQRSLPEALRMAREQGFAAVEMAISPRNSAPELRLDFGPDDCRRVVDAACEAGVQLAGLANGCAWEAPMLATDADVARRGLDIAAQTLRLAQWLQVDAVLTVPGYVGSTARDGVRGVPYDVAYDNALKALRELIPLAEQSGVSLAIENVWNKFLLSPLEMRGFIDTLASDKVGAYFDVGNVVPWGYPEQWIAILGRRIKRVHFKDFKREVGTGEGFCPLLEGDVDYPAVMQSLREVGYDGFVTAEFFNCEADLPQISRAMDRILAM